ncbi:helix-turn-helix transcriptional regulator [Paenibacillus paeoniae]|uniref:YafY family transcriptional regulator n=1 Tax=Paenibacillus paeoniae TaxID=2292705 RepID=A0A371P648_9BACL|nr:YafY family protein [Paenibacillus paeoniae]REK71423.1 YafY family transcriptional regulator [Paenibacillus paeoniae]
MRAGRLVSIVLLLQSEGKLTSKQLAERLEVTERTVLRDMEELSGAGVPVYAERGPQGGWLLTEGYRSSLTGLHSDELTALLLSSQGEALSDLGQRQSLEAGLRKLLAATTDTARRNAELVRSKIHIDGAGWHAEKYGKEQHPLLPIVQEAVWEERELRIAYERDGAVTDRVLRPLGLVAKRNVWYVVAWTEEEEIRTFRISRFRSAELLLGGFRPPESFNLAAYWERSLAEFKVQLPRYPAVIRLKPNLMRRLESERYVLSVRPEAEKDAEGWTKADVEFETLESACQIMMSYGAGMEALEPAELRKMVIDEIEALRVVYWNRA